jgi:RNA polymerase sigma-70 factor (ECF subfamily)
MVRRMLDAPAEAPIGSLAERASRGDRGAFTALVGRTHGTVYRVALRIVGVQADAEEVVQDTFVRAWEGLPALRDPAAAQGWLCQIARHLAHDRLRARMRRPADPLDGVADRLTSGEAGADDRLGSAKLGEAVRTAMAGLKEKHRLVLALREIDGMTYEEIAGALGCAVGTVESRLHRARQALLKKVKALRKEVAP